ncbi:MAG: membrane protein insertase YidC [Lactobacillales bacterium]|jgi:YidC/Oxa1 family membrane protein insertase|nr:membrane protein insertase YidC [Lactobacillales bacterium]
MKKIKLTALSLMSLAMLFSLSGCIQYDKAHNPKGPVWDWLGLPMSHLIDWIHSTLHVNYGWAIIIITFIVRLVIMPINISTSKLTMYEAEKTQYLKPYVEPLQAKMKGNKDQAETMRIHQEIQAFYKANGVSQMAAMGKGCLPMLIQMPVWSALYAATSADANIKKDAFFGFSLGSPQIVFVIIIGALYLFQSFLTTLDIPDEQKSQSRMMMIMMPVMMVFISMAAPGGLALYWVAGGVMMVLQTVITHIIMKPRLKAQVAREFEGKEIIKPSEASASPAASATASPAGRKDVTNSVPSAPSEGRNAGKQRPRD